MAFSDELDALVKHPKTERSCKVRNVLNSPKLSEDDREKLTQVVNAPRDSNGFINNLKLSKFLQAQGFEIAVSSIDRHRRADCACAQGARLGASSVDGDK